VTFNKIFIELKTYRHELIFKQKQINIRQQEKVLMLEFSATIHTYCVEHWLTMP